MTIQEFYSHVGGDYEEVIRRLGNESRIKRILGMLSRDGSMNALGAALEQKDYKTAFQAAHALKGIVLNLGLTNLAVADSELTETLRPLKECGTIGPQYEQVRQCYEEAVDAIDQLLAVSEAGRKEDDS